MIARLRLGGPLVGFLVAAPPTQVPLSLARRATIGDIHAGCSEDMTCRRLFRLPRPHRGVHKKGAALNRSCHQPDALNVADP